MIVVSFTPIINVVALLGVLHWEAQKRKILIIKGKD